MPGPWSVIMHKTGWSSTLPSLKSLPFFSKLLTKPSLSSSYSAVNDVIICITKHCCDTSQVWTSGVVAMRMMWLLTTAKLLILFSYCSKNYFSVILLQCSTKCSTFQQTEATLSEVVACLSSTGAEARHTVYASCVALVQLCPMSPWWDFSVSEMSSQ